MTVQNSYQLSTAATANGDGSEALIERPGHYIYNVLGTWNGATITLKVKPSGFSTYRNVTGAAFTADGGVELYCAIGDTLKDTISSAGGSTSLTSSLHLVEQF